MIHDWQNFLTGHASEWGVSGNGEWKFLLHNNYHPQCSNINVLWFQDKSEFPVLVTKLCREPDSIRREYENLKRVYDSATTRVPRPLYFGQQGSFWSLWMEGLPGARYTAQTRHSSSTLRSMVEMVASLHEGIGRGAPPSALDRYAKTVALPFRSVAEFGESAIVKEGCVRLAAGVTPEWIGAMPVIPQHGDLFCDNLLLDRGKWHVLDWESFGSIDLPFYDLLTLLLSLVEAMDREPAAWDARVVRQIPELVEQYAGTLGLPSGAVREALPLTLANWFHLQWRDGRQDFSLRMYKTLERYFSSPDSWERVFLRK